MPIIRATTFIDAYRARASSNDINELSGRTDRPDLTAFVSKQIISKLFLSPNYSLLDVGCGDGSLLIEATKNGINDLEGRLIGLLPSTEEVVRVREHLDNITDLNNFILIKQGLAQDTRLPSEYFDIVICNGVLLLLQNDINVSKALKELSRVTKIGGQVFIGEIPDQNEMVQKNYGNSIVLWLFWVLKNQGFKVFYRCSLFSLKAVFTNQPLIISPKNFFYISPKSFTNFLSEHGFEVLEIYKHKEIDQTGSEFESKTRWDYVCRKI